MNLHIERVQSTCKYQTRKTKTKTFTIKSTLFNKKEENPLDIKAKRTLNLLGKLNKIIIGLFHTKTLCLERGIKYL